ncbi:MAG: DEAD/DEAH box helicase family protein [Candidatus Thermoplasmatota archaeon]|nr:DEAD/DEAH box helicase family protein [Candidatus Thermoplasmatota archaeon]
MYLQHEFIKPHTVEQRDYQNNIATSAADASTLVVLPTGMGKTIIALLVIAKDLKKNKNILFLSPTKPLVNQHAQSLAALLTLDDAVAVFTGEVSPEKRVALWNSKRIIVSTPQVIENDLIAHRYDLSNIGRIIFDEAHRAAGNYSYVFIAEMFKKQQSDRRCLGMTASPGNNLSEILEVCKNLEITNIEIRTKVDPDVRPYVYDLDIKWKEIPLPHEFTYTLQLLRKTLAERLKILKDLQVLDSASISLVNRKKLLAVQQQIQSELRSSPHPSQDLFKAASAQNAAMKLIHAIELLQTQGVNALGSYMVRMASEASSKGGSKASRDIMKDPNVLEAIAYIKSLKIEHPKIQEIVNIVKEQVALKKDSKIIIFTHYRDTSLYVLKQLETIPNVKPVRFIGQAGKESDKGLTQKEQIDIIKRFKKNDFNVLIATSVAEEGLDIPSTDLVVFYEPVPSEIRTIQRKGRTARQMAGKVLILIAKGTPDEAYYWSSRQKERNMHKELEVLRSALRKRIQDPSAVYRTTFYQGNQKKLDEYSKQSTVKIIVDHRESRSPVMRFLTQKDILVEPQQLDVGDYILSSRIAVERKTVDDFLSSLIEGKLFVQMKNLRATYSRPLLLIEGEGLLTKRNISHNAIYGSFTAIMVDFGIPIITTHSSQETAEFLAVMAQREQKEGDRAVAVRGEKTARTISEQQQFLVEGLPNVSAVLAQRLLQHFGSVRSLANASVEDLCKINGIGKNIAADILKILNTEYMKE